MHVDRVLGNGTDRTSRKGTRTQLLPVITETLLVAMMLIHKHMLLWPPQRYVHVPVSGVQWYYHGATVLTQASGVLLVVLSWCYYTVDCDSTSLGW